MSVIDNNLLSLKLASEVKSKINIILSYSECVSQDVFVINNEIQEVIEHKKKKWFITNFYDNLWFLTQYLITTSVIFIVLFGATNFSAYFWIIWSYLNPSSLKASGKDIMSALDSGKIQVYAKEDDQSDKIKKAKEKMLESQMWKLENNSLSPKSLISNNDDISMDIDVVPYENRLVIPKIGKNVPLVNVDARRSLTPDNIHNVFMEELKKWVVRYPGTGIPGQEWNIFIFGHSSNMPWVQSEYNDVFALLDKLEIWDEMIVYYDQHKYVYSVKEKVTVKPWDVNVTKVEPGKKEMSLVTCWPVWTTWKRLVVVTELKK